MKRIICSIFAAACIATGAWAKTNIEVRTPHQIVFGRAFDVAYIVDGNGQEINLKTNEQFEVIAGPYRYAEDYTVREKGRLVIRTRTAYTYRMVPRVSGEVKLPKAKVKLTKGSATSKAEKVNVLEPRQRDPFDFWGMDPFFDQPAPPACGQHHPGRPHRGRHPHHQGECPHHEVHVETFTPEQVDTTGCELTVCAPDSAIMGETFCLSYAIGAQADSIQLSDTTDFEIVGGPGYGTSWQSVWQNGQQQNRFEQRYTYIVRARKAGELNLPKAQVWVGQTRKESEQKTISIQPSENK